MSCSFSTAVLTVKYVYMVMCVLTHMTLIKIDQDVADRMTQETQKMILIFNNKVISAVIR